MAPKRIEHSRSEDPARLEDALPPSKTKQSIGVDGSVFGPETSERFIKDLLARNNGNKRQTLFDFLELELKVRGMLSKPSETRRWQDSGNVYMALAWEGDGVLKKIETGEDVKTLKNDLEDSRARGIFSIKEMEETARIYLAARKRLFPNAPTPKD